MTPVENASYRVSVSGPGETRFAVDSAVLVLAQVSLEGSGSNIRVFFSTTTNPAESREREVIAGQTLVITARTLQVRNQNATGSSTAVVQILAVGDE